MNKKISYTRITAILLGVLFVGLKLCNQIDWSWWIVLLPLYYYVIYVIIAIVAVLILGEKKTKEIIEEKPKKSKFQKRMEELM